jgi:hypothetical protein
MSFEGRLERTGVKTRPSAAQALSGAKIGDLVRSPVTGPFKGVPMNVLDPMAFYRFFDDFDEFHNGAGELWDEDAITNAATAAFAQDNTYGNTGIIVGSCGATGGDGISVQTALESGEINSGKRGWFSCRVLNVLKTGAKCRFGMHVSSTDPMGTLGYSIYFEVSGAGAVSAGMKNSSGAETLTSDSEITAATWHEYAFRVNADGSVNFYFDRTHLGELSTYLPVTEDLNPTLAFISTGAGAKSLCYDYINWIQEERT